jgi:hypothetical protein
MRRHLYEPFNEAEDRWDSTWAQAIGGALGVAAFWLILVLWGAL